ncbi:response regulator [Lacrimispora algidixylanolytica]|uniref:Stage 0 sporulation protein A homolog n=1 Tax=Lacrimispora algidixylanolytica TaxID=94868 RepID=A0A419T886_9FIRM|nr:response regulator [Lacrimispora algidixylanolytica]RKD33633.1 DNA-binding response regulator [Lacrimispora algidixylanolytica]
MKLFISDDEIDVREGIRYLLNWSELGFYICGEGKNGQDTLEQIIRLMPDVVLLDIRMPKLSGLEVIKRAREQGFSGRFILLSGYSDFSYAQEAIRFGVTCYLTKPIEEKELEKAVLEAKESIRNELDMQKKLLQYRDKARDSILHDILFNKANDSFLDYHDMMLESYVYQVVLYANYNQDSFQATWDFAEILRLANKNHNSLEFLKQNDLNVIILKGDFALNRFQELVEHYISQPQKGSPLDSLFLTYGKPVYSAEHIHSSFEDAQLLMKRRFFCHFNQHVLGYMDLPKDFPTIKSNAFMENTYPQQIGNHIQSANHQMLQEVLDQLKKDLYFADLEVPIVKHTLADIMIQVKSILTHTYCGIEIPFPNNAAIISTIEEKYYLYEILDFFTLQFEMCMNAIGSPTRENVMDGILHYIQYNYQENLKLGTIADLFGYNSSYLGKVFHKATGKSFNSYIDEVRIENSKKSLLNDENKVYEIALLVGYTDVNYFHKKFKKYVGMSPAEYRRFYQ